VLAVTIRPPPEVLANAETARSISRRRAPDRAQLHPKRGRYGLNCGQLAGAGAMAESRRTATRFTLGNNLLKQLQPFPLIPYRTR